MEPLSRLRRIRVLAVGVVLGLAALAGVLATRGSAVPPGPTFAPPVYVDQDLAGGEPEVFADTQHGTLIYTSHEGTTHLYRDGIVSSPWGDFSFVTNYCNQVTSGRRPTAASIGSETATSGVRVRRARLKTPASATPT